MAADRAGLSAEQVEHMKESGRAQDSAADVSLFRSISSYVTAWATPDGVVQFRPRPLPKDGVGEIAAAY